MHVVQYKKSRIQKKIKYEKEWNISDVIQKLKLSDEVRTNLHSVNSSLNVMVLKILSDSNDQRFHWNVDRDEIICVLEGQVEIQQNLSGKIFSHVIEESPDNFFTINANVSHRIRSITPYSYILEIIGGEYKLGGTKYEC
jgi:mannose-6-phosphate isomerase-like protein (cupin superfamily)